MSLFMLGLCAGVPIGIAFGVAIVNRAAPHAPLGPVTVVTITPVERDSNVRVLPTGVLYDQDTPE